MVLKVVEDADILAGDSLASPVDISLAIHGPAAFHNMPCAIHQDQHAVYSMPLGVFEPSWKAQGEGWALVKIRPGREWLFKLLRKYIFSPHTCSWDN